MAEDAARHAENRPRLGRGLAALLGDAAEEARRAARGRAQRKTPIEFLRPNPRNPRKNFDDAELEELAASIRERGVIQPVLVRAIPRVADAYRDRRRRAALARGATRRPARNSDRRHRGRRSRGARTRHRRERPARRSQRARRGERLCAARRRSWLFARRHRAHHRQEPQPHRQHAAAAEIAGVRALPARLRPDLGRPCPGAARGRRSRRGRRAHHRERPDRPRCRAARRQRARRDGRARAAPARAQAEVDADTRALEHSLSLALGTSVTIRHRRRERRSAASNSAISNSSTNLCRRLCRDRRAQACETLAARALDAIAQSAPHGERPRAIPGLAAHAARTRRASESGSAGRAWRPATARPAAPARRAGPATICKCSSCIAALERAAVDPLRAAAGAAASRAAQPPSAATPARRRRRNSDRSPARPPRMSPRNAPSTASSSVEGAASETIASTSAIGRSPGWPAT